MLIGLLSLNQVTVSTGRTLLMHVRVRVARSYSKLSIRRPPAAWDEEHGNMHVTWTVATCCANSNEQCSHLSCSVRNLTGINSTGARDTIPAIQQDCTGTSSSGEVCRASITAANFNHRIRLSWYEPFPCRETFTVTAAAGVVGEAVESSHRPWASLSYITKGHHTVVGVFSPIQQKTYAYIKQKM